MSFCASKAINLKLNCFHLFYTFSTSDRWKLEHLKELLSKFKYNEDKLCHTF